MRGTAFAARLIIISRVFGRVTSVLRLTLVNGEGKGMRVWCIGLWTPHLPTDAVDKARRHRD